MVGKLFCYRLESGRWILRKTCTIRAYTYEGEEDILCSADNNQYEPHVSGDVVVWSDWRNYETADIYGLNLATGNEFMISSTINRKNALEASVSGHLVAWIDGASIMAIQLPEEWLTTTE